MKKAKKIILPIIVIIFLLLITFGLYLTGFFDFTDKTEIKTNTPIAAEEIEVLPSEITADIIKKYSLPDDMNGIWFDLDVNIGEEKNTDRFISEIIYDFDYFRNFCCDTIFIKPDTEGKYSSLKNSDGTDFDALACVLSFAEKNNYKIFLVCDESIVISNNNISFKNADKLLSKYRFNGVILSLKEMQGTNDFNKTAELFYQNMRESYKSLATGILLNISTKDKYIDNNSLSILQNKLADFVCVAGEISKGAKKDNFKTVYSWWNALAASFPDTVFYCLHRNDLVGTSGAGWDNYTEIYDQLKIMSDFENFYGRCYYGLNSMKKYKASSQRLSGAYYEGSDSDFSVQTMTVDNSGLAVNFTGKAIKGSKLFLNRVIADKDGGKFNLTYSLQHGENNIELRNKGNRYLYNIYDNSPILTAYSSTDELTAENGEIVPYAVARRGSYVTAEINKKEYVLLPQKDITSDVVPAGYDLYMCNIDISEYPVYKTEIGELKIKCINGDHESEIVCGSVTNSKSENKVINKIYSVVDKILSRDEEETHKENDIIKDQDYSPLYDHGLGTALMCRIIDDRTEQLSTVHDHDTYHADFSNLMEGTIDYVNGISLSEEGKIRYELNSGRAVYAEHCQLINNGYVLPENRIVFTGTDKNDKTKTDIILDTDWFVPLNVSLKPQEYIIGSADFSFNVKDFTAEYIDIDFYHTASVIGVENIDFTGSSVLKSAEVINSDDFVTLRLYLRQKGLFYGFNSSHNNNGQIIISVKERQENNLNGKVIMLDPGHGGLYMTGTALSDQSIAEKDVTISVALKAKAILESKGATVLLTRSTDVSYDLYERVAMCDKESPDIYVSIHADGSGNPESSGTHTLYFRPYSKPLAACIHKNLVKNYSEKIYDEKSNNFANIDRKIQFYPYYVTRIDTCPSVLIEMGFMTNDIEGKLLADDNVRSWLADGIANGIQDYFENKY